MFRFDCPEALLSCDKPCFHETSIEFSTIVPLRRACPLYLLLPDGFYPTYPM